MTRSTRTAPTAPTNLTAIDVEDFCGGTELRWNPSADDTDPPAAIEYEIFRNGAPFTLTPPGASFFGLYAPSGTSTCRVTLCRLNWQVNKLSRNASPKAADW